MGRGALVLAGVLLALTGCTDTTRPAGPEPTADAPAAPATSTGPVRPDYGYEPPATTAGDMSLRSFPTPAELGHDWAYQPAPASARDVNEVVKTSLPPGCSSRNPVPLPHSALEVRYSYRQIPVTAYQVDFVSPALARAFFSGRTLDLEACRQRADASGRPLLGQIVSPADGVVLSDRSAAHAGTRSTELAILTDSSVVLLQADVPLGVAPFRSARVLVLAERFRQRAV